MHIESKDLPSFRQDMKSWIRTPEFMAASALLFTRTGEEVGDANTIAVTGVTVREYLSPNKKSDDVTDMFGIIGDVRRVVEQAIDVGSIYHVTEGVDAKICHAIRDEVGDPRDVSWEIADPLTPCGVAVIAHDERDGVTPDWIHHVNVVAWASVDNMLNVPENPEDSTTLVYASFNAKRLYKGTEFERRLLFPRWCDAYEAQYGEKIPEDERWDLFQTSWDRSTTPSIYITAIGGGKPWGETYMAGVMGRYLDELWGIARTGQARTVYLAPDKVVKRLLRVKRLPASHGDVEVIALPREVHEITDRNPGAREIAWAHRWKVRGHWRNQPYGQGRKLRKWRWIAPHEKGHGPMVERERVYRI